MKRILSLLFLLLTLASCNYQATSPRWDPAVTDTFYVQLQGTVNTTVNVDVYIIDLFDNDASVVSTLHGQGKKVICYMSAGSWEDWRSDAGSFPASVKGNDLAGWPGEKYLDVRALSILQPIMTNRLKMCKDKGFDGADFDNVDTYSHGSGTTGFNITATHQIRYNRMLASVAHYMGLSANLKNDLGQISSLVDYFDSMINEQCYDYSECDLMDPFVAAGKPVWILQYNDGSTPPATFCPLALASNFRAVYTTQALDGPPISMCD